MLFLRVQYNLNVRLSEILAHNYFEYQNSERCINFSRNPSFQRCSNAIIEYICKNLSDLLNY